MGKIDKLIADPGAFVRDSKLFRRYFGEPEPVAPAKEPRKGPAAQAGPVAAAPREKSHPLPTLNLAEEVRLSDAEIARQEAEREFLRFRAAPSVGDRVVERLAGRVRGTFADIDLPDREVVGDIRDFFRCYVENPAAGAARTTAKGSLLWLFVLARALSPKVVVESGVYKGASLYGFRRALPSATVHGYDIDLSNLAFADPSIQLHQGDWSQSPPRPEGPDDLCYFDDHINNCLRVRQAYDAGFRHLVFDDSPDIGQLHKWRYPGVPTIQMVVNRTLEEGEWVEWVWKKQKLRYVHREGDTHGARDLVERMLELPSLLPLTGRATGVQTYVRLKRREDR